MPRRRERSSTAEPSSTLFEPDQPDHRFDRFHVLGSFMGRTRTSIYNLLKDHGAKVTENIHSEDISHIIVADNVWVREQSSELIRRCKRDNKDNAEAYEEDPDYHRTWFLPLEWLLKSIEDEKVLPVLEWDLEKKLEREKKDRASQLAAERVARGGAEADKVWANTSDEDGSSERSFDTASSDAARLVSSPELPKRYRKFGWNPKPTTGFSSTGMSGSFSWSNAGAGQTLGGAGPSTARADTDDRKPWTQTTLVPGKKRQMVLSDSSEDEDLQRALKLSRGEVAKMDEPPRDKLFDEEDYDWENDSDIIVETPLPKKNTAPKQEPITLSD